MTSSQVIHFRPMNRLVPRSPISRRIRRIELFLKISEACNIACTYCYFFFGGEESYKHHPNYIAQDTVDGVSAFLKRTVIESSVEELVIDFHGGEPTMLKKRRFRALCETLRRELRSLTQLSFGIQTNAMLVDDEWIGLFQEFDISIGVSIDGPAQYHNLERVDHQGHGTHSRTVAGRPTQSHGCRGPYGGLATAYSFGK